MSWDVIVIAAKSPPVKFSDDAADPGRDLGPEIELQQVPMGSCSEVRSRFSEEFFGIDWSDPTWGNFTGTDYTVEVNIGEDEPCTSVMLHVRGDDRDGEVVYRIQSVLGRTGWFAADISEGEWFHHSASPGAGFLIFKEFRDQVVSDLQTEAQKPFWKKVLGL